MILMMKMRREMKKMKEKEIRKQDIQLRASSAEDNKMEIKGYAVVFNSPETYYGYTEVIAPTAFDEADMSDVVLRYNHNDSFIILARTRNKSLELVPDEKGLFMRAKLQSDVAQHRDVYNLVKSGLISQMSFAFNVLDEKVERRDGKTHRIIKKIGRLADVSIVDVPAYEQTSVLARSLELVDTELRALDSAKSEQEKTQKKMLDAEKAKYIYKLGGLNK